MSLRFRAAYSPSGSGIVERNHHTVKAITTRKCCSIVEAVHLYNAMPRDRTTVTEVPACGIYEVQDCVHPKQEQHANDAMPDDDESKEYASGGTMWVQIQGEHYTAESQPSVITRVNSP